MAALKPPAPAPTPAPTPAPAPPPVVSSSDRVEFRADNGTWQPYGAGAMAKVRAAYMAGQTSVVDIGNYLVDLTDMTQTRKGLATKVVVW